MALVPDLSALDEFMGRSHALIDGSDDWAYQAAQHMRTVTEFVRGYTRGQGFTVIPDGDNFSGRYDVPDDLHAVILAATARLINNPAQVEREGADGWYAVGSFQGFSLPELAVLHSYRRRTA